MFFKKNKKESVGDFLKEQINLAQNLVEEIAKLLDNQYGYLETHFQKKTNYQDEKNRAHELMLKGENLTNEDRIKIAKTILKMADVYRKNIVQSLQQINNEVQIKLLELETTMRGLLEFPGFKGDIMAKGLMDVVDYYIKILNHLKVRYSNRLLATKSIVKYIECDEKLPAQTIAYGGKKNIPLTDEMKKGYAENVAEYGALMLTSWKKEKELDAEFQKLIKGLDKFQL